MASKGSTAWEAAVKAKPDVVHDDLPVGWRILEKNAEASTPVGSDGNKGKKIGGLLSFWGRKAVTPPPDQKPERSTSPAPVSTISKLPTESTHSSVEDGKLPSTSLPNQSASSVKSTPASILNPGNSTPAATAPPTEIRPPLQPEISQEQPSAVSRFLSRFSRTKSGTSSGTQSRNSLELSSDDLEFLSDIVPSAGDTTLTPDFQLPELLNMMESSPLPTKLPPPLFPPRQPTFQISANGSETQVQENGLVSLLDPLHPRGANMDSKPEASFSQPVIPSSTPSPLSSVPYDSTLPKLVNPVVGQTRTKSPSIFAELKPPPPAPSPVLGSVISPTSKFPQVLMTKSSTTSSSSNASSAFKLPPPPKSRSQTPLPPLPPNQPLSLSLPISRKPTPSQLNVLPPKPIVSLPPSDSLDNVDFSDFHSPPPPAPSEFSLHDLSFSSISSSQSLFSESVRKPNDSFEFDDFDDFVSSPIRTPSPPRPPAKPSSQKVSNAQQKRKASRAAEHSRTLSLVETAAARPGRWPAPPSPLPQALPPPGAFGSNIFDVDLFGSQQQQDSATAELKASASSPPAIGLLNPGVPNGLDNTSRRPTLLPIPPPVGLTPTPSFMQTPPVKHASHSPNFMSVISPAASVTPTESGKRGLSAQDLSFFEGL